MATQHSNRAAAWLSAALLVAGSLVFVGGGAQHPKAATAFGTVGTEEFYRTFASHIAHQPNWIPIHALILIGPLLWAVAVPRLATVAGGNDLPFIPALDDLASRALLLGAALWAIAFVLDGFVAPNTASAIQAAAPGDLPAMLLSFRIHQVTMVRLGLVSWILIGLAMAIYGTTMLAQARSRRGRSLLGTFGIAIGLWPIAATITGEFNPGPFTSSLWNVTALASAFWFAAFGVSLVARGRAVAVPAPRDATSILAHQS